MSAVSRTGLSPSVAGFPKTVPLQPARASFAAPLPRGTRAAVWPAAVSLAATPAIDAGRLLPGRFFFLFLPLLRCFSSRRVPPYGYFVRRTVAGLFPAGFPHSEIRGSMAVCASPRLFAACRVLRRLLAPRHSPFALVRLPAACRPPRARFVSFPSFVLPVYSVFKVRAVRFVVILETTGFEPVTPCLQGRCSPG